MLQATIADYYDRCVLHYADRTAISCGETSVRYAELGARADRLAGALQELGVAQGERIAFLMANCAEYFYCEYALARIGAVRVPLAVLLGSPDHVYMMNEAECSTLIYHASLRERVEQMTPSLATVRRFICVGPADALPAGHLHLDDLLAPPRPAPVKAASSRRTSPAFTSPAAPPASPRV
jgi:acyl-CoA synthetase (AMP-forming)/AMP-acid ligase II